MVTLATELKQDIPYASTATLMGRVAAPPNLRRDNLGEVSTILLHTDTQDCTTHVGFTDNPETDESGRTPHCVGILVRGMAAQWCCAHLVPGMVLLAETSLRPLCATPSGICLTLFEATRVRLIQPAPGESMPAQANMPPDMSPTMPSLLHIPPERHDMRTH